MDTNAPLKIRVSITLDEYTAKEIRKLSENEFRPFSQYINLILKKHLIDIDKKKGRTL